MLLSNYNQIPFDLLENYSTILIDPGRHPAQRPSGKLSEETDRGCLGIAIRLPIFRKIQIRGRKDASGAPHMQNIFWAFFCDTWMTLGGRAVHMFRTIWGPISRHSGHLPATDFLRLLVPAKASRLTRHVMLYSESDRTPHLRGKYCFRSNRSAISSPPTAFHLILFRYRARKSLHRNF